MLDNFHLAAITKGKDSYELFHIPLHQSLQDSLAKIWGEQLEMFLRGIQEIPFNPGYSPEQHECFFLSDYDLPDSLKDVNSLSVNTLESINSLEDQLDSISAIVGFGRNNDGGELILFQNFTRSHLISSGYYIFQDKDTYKTLKRPALTLDSKLSAVYIVEQKKLLFQNYRPTNTFLPLAEFFEEASEKEIIDILSHELFAPEDSLALAVGSNQWFRKRFTMLRESGVLDDYTAQEIVGHSKGYEIDIQLKENRIVFPAKKAEAKRLLQFLNEEIYRGPITEKLYETNSKREADQ